MMSRTALVTGWLLTAAVAGAAAQTPIDSALFAYVRGLRAIDNHAHPVSTAPGDRDFDALPIDGFPPFAFPLRLSADNPELVEAWRDLYGYRYTDRSESHLTELKALKSKAKAEQGDNYPAWVLDRLGIGVQLANRMALDRGVTSRRFRWVSFVDPLLFPLDTKALQTTPDRADLFPKTEKNLRRYLGDLGVKSLPATFGAYLSRVVTPTLERMAAGGAVAVKFEAAYLRKLDFGAASATDAGAVYDRYRTGGAPSPARYRPLQDYLFRYIGREAGRLGMAVHIHSADGAGGYFEAAGSDPLLLEPALNDSSLRRTNFVIVHGGWPNTRNTMSLFARPNVYADFSFLSNMLTAHTLAGVLREWLSAYPDRILFGSDAYPNDEVVGWEEWGWLGSVAGRKGLAMALSGMMADGEISRDRAYDIARLVMRDNAARLYRITLE
ncbi:MAG: amidohydrolase [Gemmatimonadetes bacterium]|nr:amidohydrolase [Gemmatimonadota bacterium]